MRLTWGRLKKIILNEVPGRRPVSAGQARHLGDQTQAFRVAVPGVGRYVGSGEQGDVFEYTGGNIIKAVPEWQHGDGTLPDAVVRHMSDPDDFVVPVLDAGVAELDSDWGNVYWYVMPRLRPISNDDALVIDDANQRWVNKGDRSLPEDVKSELATFVKAAISSGHTDWNSDNVMQDDAGQYKLIDLESF